MRQIQGESPWHIDPACRCSSASARRKKADEDAVKRAKRQGIPQAAFTEPKPTVDIGALTEAKHEKDETEETDSK
jgi:hypothetical protein